LLAGLGLPAPATQRLRAAGMVLLAVLTLLAAGLGVPVARVAANYQVPRGALQSLQTLASTYCGMVGLLCQRLRWYEMAALFESLQPRMSFGVSAEALPLCQIPGVCPARARALLDAGLKTVEAVARASQGDVEAALRRLYQFESRRLDGEAAGRQEAVVRQAALKVLRGAQQRVSEQVQQLEDEADAEQRQLSRATGAAGAP